MGEEMLTETTQIHGVLGKSQRNVIEISISLSRWENGWMRAWGMGNDLTGYPRRL